MSLLKSLLSMGVSFLTCLLLILQSQTVISAPTHHLSINVEGDTPTLVVTSAEIGITITPAVTIATTSSIEPVAAKKYKNSVEKLSKNKSTKTQYTKKRPQYTTAKDSKTIWREKSVPVTSTQEQIPMLGSTTETPTPLNKEPTERVTSASTPTATSTESTQATTNASVDNQYKTAALPTTDAPRKTQISGATSTSTATTQQRQEETTEATDSTTLGSLPRKAQQSTPFKFAQDVGNAAESVTMMHTTENSLIISKDGEKNDEITDSITMLDIKPIPTAMTTNFNKIENTIPTTSKMVAQATETTTNTPTTIPVITTETKLDIEELSSSTATTTATTNAITTTQAYTKSNYAEDDANVTTIQPGAATPQLAAETAPVNARQIEVTTQTPTPHQPTTTLDDTADANTQKLVSTTEAVEIPATSTTKIFAVFDALNKDKKQPKRQHDGIVKLIDLEKHYDLKSIDEVEKQHKSQPQNKDDGHDGVKETKKKQLIDKHFLADTAMEITTGATTIYNRSTEEITPPTIPADNQFTSDLRIISQQKAKKSMASPTLMPVHNGYLGPIFMEEKTFSVIHAIKPKTPPAQHVASIASQLRNGRIVEIIAPTSLLEEQKTSVQNVEGTTAKAPPTARKAGDLKNLPVLSTTVFQVPESMTSTTRLPANTKVVHLGKEPFGKVTLLANNAEQTESKISDIQIEVYDSTIDSIVASTNFKDNDGFYSLPIETSAVGTTKPPASALVEERFTQYVIDRTESSTQESMLEPLHIVDAGKPEPAAIEIHINVSEGFGNESEDLEFSYRQSDYTRNSRPNVINRFPAKAFKPKTPTKPLGYNSEQKSYTNTGSSSERSDEILVVEIIDTGENSTENIASSENINPIFTFRSDKDTEFEMKDIKYISQGNVVKPPQVSDELFMPDVKKTTVNFPKPPPPPPPPPRKPSIDRDSDTIFYISNTEVKVGESLPTANTKFEQQLRKSRLENQFFPVNYMASTHPNAAKLDEWNYQEHRYEEDIILSPLRNTADSLKIFRSQGEGAPPLDVTYVGESVMEVMEQSSAGGIITTVAPSNASQSQQPPDVIIQPAVLPEMSIGVPVIGELPPQIELKEIDFMPDEANQQRSGVYENDIEENVNSNDVDRLVESSIQYGGDLIDEGAGGGFDGVEGSYPFGNPASMRNRKAKHVADYAHFAVNHGVSNLRKDELSADVGSSSSGEVIAVGSAAAGNAENSTLKDFLNRNGNDTSMNISYAVAERMGNATAFSVMDDPAGTADGELGFKNLYTLIIGLFIVLLPVVVTVSMACALRYLYSKYQASSSDNNDNTDPHQANGNAGDGGEQGESTQPPSPSKSELDKEIFNDNDKTQTEKSIKPSNSSSHINIIDEMCQGGAKNSQINSKEIRPISQSDQSNSVQGQYSGPNGSITKMTMQNNHLIVETEERNDMSRDARETKMHYNTSEKDGVFVVEVARGVDSKTIPDSPIADASEKRLPVYESAKLNGGINIKTEDEKMLKNHEEVQIHQPPPEIVPNTNAAEEMQRSLHQIEEVDEPTPSPNSAVCRNAAGACEENTLARNSNTGLSQSDLSSTSSTDSNKRYSYGNQELYIIEQPGYATISSTANLPLITPSDDEAQDDDRKSENGHSLEHSPAQVNGEVAKKEISENNTMSNDNAGKESLPSKTEKCQLNGYIKDEHNTYMDSHDINKEKSIETMETSEKIPQIPDEITVAVAITEIEHLSRQQAKIQDEILLAAATTTTEITDSLQKQSDVCDELTSMATIESEEQKPTVMLDNMPTITEITNTATDTSTTSIEEHELKQTNGYSNGDHNASLLNGQSEEAEQTYDSIMSLPDPPSTEEITQLNDYSSLNVDSNQLDSLPPPPPPPLLNETIAVNGTAEHTNERHNEMLTSAARATAPLKQFLQHEFLADEILTSALINGDSEQPQLNGHETSAFLSSLPPPMEVVTTSNGKILPATLTPPASPPPSPPAHFSNGGVGMSSLPVAVDVNGS